MKILTDLTDLTYLPDLTIYEKLKCCRSSRYHLLCFMELHVGSGSIACGCLGLGGGKTYLILRDLYPFIPILYLQIKKFRRGISPLGNFSTARCQ